MTTGDEHTCARQPDGSAWCWGDGAFGQLGDGGTADSNTPVQVIGPGGSGTLSGVSQIGGGTDHSCAVLDDGTVYCWGTNMKGQLGDGGTADSNTPVQVVGPGGVGTLSGVQAVAAGKHSTCALLTDGTVSCWGSNGSGQLGDGTSVDSPTPVTVAGVGGTGDLDQIVEFAVGQGFACAADSSGLAYCWGDNWDGQLGDGTERNSRAAPVEVGGPGGVGVLTGVVRLGAAGHTCATTIDGSAFCWGNNRDGQVGDGTTHNRYWWPVQVLGPGGVGSLSGVWSLGLSESSSCARTYDGSAWCWGSDGKGKLGDGVPDADSPTPVQVGPTGPANLTEVTALSAGSGKEQHACAARIDGSIWCWGSNAEGQVGDGTNTDRSAPVQVLP